MIVKEVVVIGIEWSFVFIVVVVRDDWWGRIYESYFENFDLVKDYVGEMVVGI